MNRNAVKAAIGFLIFITVFLAGVSAERMYQRSERLADGAFALTMESLHHYDETAKLITIRANSAIRSDTQDEPEFRTELMEEVLVRVIDIEFDSVDADLTDYENGDSYLKILLDMTKALDGWHRNRVAAKDYLKHFGDTPLVRGTHHSTINGAYMLLRDAWIKHAQLRHIRTWSDLKQARKDFELHKLETKRLVDVIKNDLDAPPPAKRDT